MAFVYKHITLKTKKVFYIGIGKTKNRATAFPNRNKEWWKIAAKGFMVQILHDDIDFQTAKELERFYILRHGRLDLGTGTLTNLTSGGQGVTNPSALTRFKIGSARRGVKVSKKTRLKQSQAKKGKHPWNYGKKYTPEQMKTHVGFKKGNVPWNKKK